jgi:hypothetical protein
MKTRSVLKKSSYILVCLFFLLPCLLTAQPEYSFKTPALQSGTALQTGAVYRFSNVKTGADALVTITFITAGCTLSQFDNDGAGYSDAFQPEILVPAHTNGYTQFHIAFVAAGTNTPMTMGEIPATAIDIDGNNGLWGGPLNEFDAISTGASSYVDYNMLGGQLTVSYTAGWVQALNTGGAEYGGINISATSVMMTTVNAGTTAFDYRTGVNNQSNISTLNRQKSLYFRKFTYPNSVLSQPAVVSFNATHYNNETIVSCTLYNTANAKQVTIEKSLNGKTFTVLKSYSVSNEMPDPERHIHYTDASPSISQQVYYRLQVTGVSGELVYSKLLLLNSNMQPGHVANIFPSIIHSDATLLVTAEKNSLVSLRVLNLNGSEVLHKVWIAGEGRNSFSFTVDNHLPAGIYIARMYANGSVKSKKIVIQPF